VISPSRKRSASSINTAGTSSDVSELRPQEATKRVGHFCPYPLGHQHHSRKRIQSLTKHLALLQQENLLFHGGPDPKELAHFIEGTAEA